jgi:hypothetical protein
MVQLNTPRGSYQWERTCVVLRRRPGSSLQRNCGGDPRHGTLRRSIGFRTAYFWRPSTEYVRDIAECVGDDKTLSGTNRDLQEASWSARLL